MEVEQGVNDIRLRVCPFCGGQPIVLVMRQVFDSTVMIQCSQCGVTTGGVMFRSMKSAAMARRDLLPDLATARRQAAAAWNGGAADDGADEEPAAAGPA